MKLLSDFSLLKIWNMNKYTGVLGVYNSQGAAWNSVERKNTFHQTGSEALTGAIRGRDVHLIAEAAIGPDWNGDCVAYCHRSGELVTLPYNASLPVSLKVLEHDIFTVTPNKVIAPGFSFAPLGLINMFNAGGAIDGLEYQLINGASKVSMEAVEWRSGRAFHGRRFDNFPFELAVVILSLTDTFINFTVTSINGKDCEILKYSLEMPIRCIFILSKSGKDLTLLSRKTTIVLDQQNTSTASPPE
ncbi:probable galactinol--sucrose galactosyltransferase 6 [Tripterygium wilfordii]|uniref:probable galactinol--sucrose galactosyltransferase 6 n=1 Tax=Tripterygium wilfordii TaxID=458696 RepID=UPI0018F80075|nr:probable galactinol--sucrose galactosyltransferase 6 [Tripterygium wilfordii]